MYPAPGDLRRQVCVVSESPAADISADNPRELGIGVNAGIYLDIACDLDALAMYKGNIQCLDILRCLQSSMDFCSLRSVRKGMICRSDAEFGFHDRGLAQRAMGAVGFQDNRCSVSPAVAVAEQFQCPVGCGQTRRPPDDPFPGGDMADLWCRVCGSAPHVSEP